MAVPKRFSDWEEQKAPKDYDPEADAPDASQGESDSEADADATGTEHYLSVGKSKLRQKDSVALGPQYRGTKVSRDDLMNDDDGEDQDDDEEEDDESSGSAGSDAEFDDPDTADVAADTARLAGHDSEIESDDVLGSSDEEALSGFVFRGSSEPRAKKGGKRPTAADFISDSENEVDGLEEANDDDDEDSDDADGADLLDLEASEETDGSDDDLSGSGSDQESDDDDDDEEDDSDASDLSDDATPKTKKVSADARAEQRRLMNEGQKALIATMSAAARQDAEKGVAVRQQRKVFDGLLNIRIRLQKAIVATNSFVAFDDEGDHELAPYEAAEEAALKLLDTLSSVRESLLPQQAAGEKRKRETNDSEALWSELQEVDARAAKVRRKVLENWSSKTKSSVVEVKSRNLASAKQSITASLEDQLLNSDRLIKRTRTPRSCAPVQIAKKINEDEAVYDDADFYQLLLKELVDQRTSDETSARAGSASVATVRWAAMKEARTKKHVDRRASKGRKMRFNVHEKLQNFMAPEDRRSWEQDAIDRLFGTLFGNKMELNEGVAASDDDMDDASAEAEGLRLFRS